MSALPKQATRPNKWMAMLDVARRSPAQEVALTPKETIWTKNKARLYRYFPACPAEAAPSLEAGTPAASAPKSPVLLVYALINRPYVMDLYPGRSLVEHLANRGHQVYLLDWGDWGPEDRDIGFDHLVYDYIPRAARQVMRHSASPDYHLLGYCMGGTIASIYAALNPGPEIRSLILTNAPIDFSDYGLFSLWLSEENFALEKLVQTLGNIPPEMIDFGNKMLKPVANYVSPLLTFGDHLDDQAFTRHFLALNHWVNDGVPFPGAAFRQWIQDFFRENKLIRGELVLRGHRVDLGRITCPVLCVTASQDHIVPPKQAEPIIEATSSQKKKFVRVKAGHVGLMTGPTGPKEVYPLISDWLRQ